MSFGRLGGMGRGFGHMGAPLGGATPSPAPSGFTYLLDNQGNYILTNNGSYILVKSA